MKTKLVKFEAPKESTIYNPPLKLLRNTLQGYAEHTLHAFIHSKWKQMIFESSMQSFDPCLQEFFIEVPDEPQRMTRLQVFQLLNRGGWIAKDADGLATLSPQFYANSLDIRLGDGLQVSRIDKIEWIEPTTDLLD